MRDMRSIFNTISAIIILSAVAMSASVGAEPSQHSTFNQEIKLIDCTKTGTMSGTTETIDYRCDDAVLPTVDKLSTHDTNPKISGTYHSFTASTLRVAIGGQIYILGVDDALSAKKDGWKLNLSKEAPLRPGTYDVVVEVVTGNGLILRDSTRDELTILGSSRIADANCSIKHMCYCCLIAIISIIGHILWVVYWLRRKKDRKINR